MCHSPCGRGAVVFCKLISTAVERRGVESRVQWCRERFIVQTGGGVGVERGAVVQWCSGAEASFTHRGIFRSDT